MSSYTHLVYHVVFSTKDRAPVISAPLRQRLYPYLGGIVRGERGVLIEIGGVADHVHLLIRLRPDVSVATMLRLVKANSSKWINDNRKTDDRFHWQIGYSAFSVSESQLERVRAYIRTQEEHHRRRTFREELAALLRRNRIDFDERYLL